MEKRISNYEIMRRRMQESFAAYDMDRIAAEWELEQEDGFLLPVFAGRQYRIDKRSGAVSFETQEGIREADFNVSMTLFDILTRKKQPAAGSLLPVSAFSPMYSSGQAYGNLFQREAKQFDHRAEALTAACAKLGGQPYGKGDGGGIFPVFKDLQAAVDFWEPDDEFGPQLNLFCDANALCYMHYETLMYMLLHIVERLRELL